MGLHSEIVSQHMEAFLAHSRHLVRDIGGDTASQIESLHERMLVDLFEHFGFRHPRWSDRPAHGALGADVPRERARVQVRDPRDSVLSEIGFEADLGAPIGVESGSLADDEARHPRRRGFTVLRVRTVVADERVRHRHQLARVGRIGEHLLVPGHASIEHDLTERDFMSADEVAVEATSVFKQ